MVETYSASWRAVTGEGFHKIMAGKLSLSLSLVHALRFSFSKKQAVARSLGGPFRRPKHELSVELENAAVVIGRRRINTRKKETK